MNFVVSHKQQFSCTFVLILHEKKPTEMKFYTYMYNTGVCVIVGCCNEITCTCTIHTCRSIIDDMCTVHIGLTAVVHMFKFLEAMVL